jgi:hypothetical protein
VQNRSVVKKLNLTRPLKEDPNTNSYFQSTTDERHIVGMRPWHDFAEDRRKTSRQTRSRKSGMVCFKLECEGRQVLASSRCYRLTWVQIFSPHKQSTPIPQCRNPNLGLVTKARACKSVGQEGAQEAHFMLPRVQKSVREWTFTFPRELPLECGSKVKTAEE